MTIKGVLKTIWLASPSDLIQYKEGVAKTPYKPLADIINAAWRICSGSGIIVAGLVVSTIAQQEMGLLLSTNRFLSTADDVGGLILWPLATFIIGVTPAITGDVFGAMQLWAGRDIVHFDVKIKREVAK
jgi:hypothetical protein